MTAPPAGTVTADSSAAWFAETIRNWFLQHGRRLPWRNSPSPYEVYVSEIMLQQTQVSTVIPYYERWMARFPDVRSLAAADLDEVLRYWAGLGYYRRARYLHEGAKAIAGRFEGNFPQTLSELRKVPGVGAYTAGAIASFAFGQDVAAIDGNAERVLSRFFGIAGDLSGREPRRRLENVANQIAARGFACDTNQAIMDIGASCCGKTARCEACPLADRCYALKNGLADSLPHKKKRQAKYDEFRAALRLALPDGRILLARKTRDALLGGLWEFPMIEIARGKSIAKDAEYMMRLPRIEQWRGFLNSLSVENERIAISGWRFGKNVVNHAFTHIEMRAALDCANADAVPVLPQSTECYDAFAFAKPEEIGTTYAVSTLMRKLGGCPAFRDFPKTPETAVMPGTD